MEKNRYLISEAADLLNVEAHVLRYWEDELDLKIPRNEMGHRYYTKENLDQFKRIEELKEEGYQLKAIKMAVHNQNQEVTESTMTTEPVVETTKSTESKLQQFQNMMNVVVRNAIADSNREMGLEVTDKIIKEMNYLMREQDEQEEARYKRLDEVIREHQRNHRSKEKKKEPLFAKFSKSKITT